MSTAGHHELLVDETGLVHRPARQTAPARDPEPVTVQRPPILDEEGGGGMGFLGLIPLLGAAGSMTVMMLFRGSPFAAVGALMMIVTVLGAVTMLFSQRGRAGRRRRNLRENYLGYLEEYRHELIQAEYQHRRTARRSDPPPSALHELIRDPHRLWERRRGHEDYLRVRLGSGEVPGPQIRLEGDTEAGRQPDPHLSHELTAFMRRFESAPDMPLTVPLARHRTISVVGDVAFGHQAVRNLVLTASALHSPEDLQIAAAVPGEHAEAWAWLARLPHCLDQSRPTPLGPLHRVESSLQQLRDLLDAEIRRRYQRFAEVRRNTMGAGAQATTRALSRLLVVDLDRRGAVENLEMPDPTITSHDLGITVIHLVARQQEEPGDVSLRIVQTEGGVRIEDLLQDPLSPATTRGVLAPSEPGLADGLCRMLAPLRLSPDSLEHNEDQEAQRFTSFLGIRDFSHGDLQRLWRPRQVPDFLKIPIGVDDRGQPVNLDIKESAQHGMGPHGLCVGATGSGKSELLRTLVLGLAVTHPPELLNLVLVDYKGGATFAPFAGIPHVAGIITNLAEDASLVDRVYASLEGEIQRRQEVLKQAGNIASITEYLHHRAQHPDREDLPPLPHLFLVIDEFGELLTAQPDFIDLFMSIGRIGRSIGVHLLLSSQRIEAGKLRGLESYLSYRLGLRTLSEGESRTVLESPDAFHLPPLPGYGYLKVDTTVYQRFKAGYVSGPLAVETEEASPVDDAPLPVVRNRLYARQMLEDIASLKDDDAGTDAERRAAEQAEQFRAEGPSVLSAVVELMRTHERVTDSIWLPPLPEALTLGQAVALGNPAADPLTGRAGQDGQEGHAGHPGQDGHAGVWPRERTLHTPIGVLDDPAHQWQGTWSLDLTRAGGHVAVLGGPSSGKSTLLRTVATSLAATHSPTEVALYGIDLKGSGLLALQELPHSAGMAARTSREALRRTVEEVSDLLDERERLFEQRGIDSTESMRRMHAGGELAELEVADAVLLVDGWGGLIDEYEDLQELIYGILTRGGGYGVHVVATANRWNEVRMAQQSFFGTRLELRLSDPAESSHGSKIAARIPADRPGRGFDPEQLIGQVALPSLDHDARLQTAHQGLADAVARLKRTWPQRTPRRVRILPQELSPGQLKPSSRPGVLALGLSERDHTTTYLDLAGTQPHLLALGDELSGKSTLLRHLMCQLIEQYSPDELVFAVFDPRRTLQDTIPDQYLGGYATSSLLADRLTAAVSRELAGRVPDDPLAIAPAAGRQGPRVVLVVDDYDVLTAGGAAPLRAFSEYLAMGAEIGLHALVARRVRGASRGLFEPFIGALREAGGATLVMDGDRSEGSLVNNVRPRRQPPGRGQLVHGGGTVQTVQVPFAEPVRRLGSTVSSTGSTVRAGIAVSTADAV